MMTPSRAAPAAVVALAALCTSLAGCDGQPPASADPMNPQGVTMAEVEEAWRGQSVEAVTATGRRSAWRYRVPRHERVSGR
jgi:hypothetical protein